MSKGLSIHIGVIAVDSAQYTTTTPSLESEGDANAMQQIADSLGYQSLVLPTKQATAARVLQELQKAAENLAPGDILLVTFSGNGGQVNDTNGDEDDGKDEVWCLYDRMLLDDELAQAWTKFKPGVRIFVISDSCHSGTVLMEFKIPRQDLLLQKKGTVYQRFANGRVGAVRTQYDSQYDEIQKAIPKDIKNQVQASVLLISACQDDQMTSGGSAGSRFGQFTEALLQVWSNGNFNGNYKTFASAISRLTGPEQSPNYCFIGQPNPGFEGQKPFTITAP